MNGNKYANIRQLIGCLYPSELKGISKIELKGNSLYITTNTPSRHHKPIRVIPNVEQEQYLEFLRFIQEIKGLSVRQIERRIKKLFGVSTRVLRKTLANQVLIKTQNLGKVKNTLGHNKMKNVAYYLNPLEIADKIGEQQTLELLNKTEYGMLLNLIRLAVRVELKRLYKNSKIDYIK